MDDNTRVAQEKEERSHNPAEVDGSSPSPRTYSHHKWHLFEWNRQIWGNNSIYMTRWMLDLWFFSIRLHKFHRSDDDRALHDHPWWFITFILSGGYYDVTDIRSGNNLARFLPLLSDSAKKRYFVMGAKWCRPGSFHFRPFGYRHTVQLRDGKPSWSIILTGRHRHRWGFYVTNSLGEERFVPSQRYFREFRHH